MKYRVCGSREYGKSLKKLLRSGKFTAGAFRELQCVINTLARGEKVDEKYFDHQLKGELKKFRECHIRFDLLLKYEIRENELILILIELGSHSELFG